FLSYRTVELWLGNRSFPYGATVNNLQAEDPYAGVAPLLKLASDWLAHSKGGNVPLELAVQELRWRGDWRLSIYRTFKDIQGVSVVMPRGDWFLEAHGTVDAVFLANTAVVHGRRPATLTTTERVSALVRPFLLDQGGIHREHKLRTLKCTKPLAAKGGRWATRADLPRLKKYEKQIDRTQSKLMDTSWEALIARKELAVFTANDSLVASIRRYGPAPSFAGIADLYVVPKARRSNIATRLTGFVVGALLAQRNAVYVFVDESDTSTLAFYRALGFEDLETYYKASLK
ncbi:MAG: GNAT family N-acetyltransferase, partial [Pyrinomonadaceae bacterium]